MKNFSYNISALMPLMGIGVIIFQIVVPFSISRITTLALLLIGGSLFAKSLLGLKKTQTSVFPRKFDKIRILPGLLVTLGLCLMLSGFLFANSSPEFHFLVRWGLVLILFLIFWWQEIEISLNYLLVSICFVLFINIVYAFYVEKYFLGNFINYFVYLSDRGDPYYRVSALFAGVNQFGSWCAMFTILVLLVRQHFTGPAKQKLWLVALSLSLTGLFMSGSKSATIITIMFMFLIGGLNKTSLPTRLGIVFMVVSTLPRLPYLSDLLAKIEFLGYVDVFRPNPPPIAGDRSEPETNLFGERLDQALSPFIVPRSEIPAYLSNKDLGYGHAHNFLVDIFIHGGLIALLGGVVFISAICFLQRNYVSYSYLVILCCCSLNLFNGSFSSSAIHQLYFAVLWLTLSSKFENQKT